MKKKFTLGKAIALIIVVLLIGTILFFANAFLGNPISYALTSSAAKKYVAENYANYDVKITDIGYNFKDTNYYVHIASESSADTHFSLTYTMGGKLRNDSFESDVLGLWNTLSRLERAFDNDIETLLSELPYEYDMLGASLLSENSLNEIGSLKLDMPYERESIPIEKSDIFVYIYSENRTFEELIRVAREIDAHLERNGVPNLYMYTIELEPPMDANGNKVFDGSDVGALDFNREILAHDDETLLAELRENWRLANIVDGNK